MIDNQVFRFHDGFSWEEREEGGEGGKKKPIVTSLKILSIPRFIDVHVDVSIR